MYDRQLSTPAVNVHLLSRQEAQRVVGRTPLRDVLLSLKKSRLVLRFRITARMVRIETRSTLAFLVELHSGERGPLEHGEAHVTSLHRDPGGGWGAPDAG
jgi:hypothetical protein